MDEPAGKSTVVASAAASILRATVGTVVLVGLSGFAIVLGNRQAPAPEPAATPVASGVTARSAATAPTGASSINSAGTSSEEPPVATELAKSGATLHGRVVDLPTARGVVGAVVTASGELDVESLPAPPGRLSTISGDNGEFVLQGLRPGVIRLSAATPTMATQAATLVPVTLGDELEGVEVWVDVPREGGVNGPDLPDASTVAAPAADDGGGGGIVSGVVTDALGHPAGNVWVTARRDDDGPAASSALTDAQGQFTLVSLGDGPYRVSAYGLTMVARATRTAVRPGDPVSLALGGLGTIVLRARSGGHAVSSFDVVLTGPVTRREHVEDVDGECRLRWLDPGSYQLAVKAGDASWKQKVDLAPDAVELRAASLVRRPP